MSIASGAGSPTGVRSQPHARGSILVVDDEGVHLNGLLENLRDEGYEVTGAMNGEEAIVLLDKQPFELIITDIRMPGIDGLDVLRHAREVAPHVPVILMTAHATVETAVEALRRGARDYVLKPFHVTEMLSKIEQHLHTQQIAWENEELRHQVECQWDFDSLVGRSTAMREVMNLVRRVGPTPSTVLITGESGVGKEVVARAVHHFSDYRDRIFLPVNCGAIPENLLESQLFGHVRGAFTGAVSNQEGLFQRAKGGTIFLDEIADMPFNLQVKLLRAIEGKEIQPLGAGQPLRIEVRIIASTNRDLGQAVEQGRFRDDLFYRLNVVNIEIPPLRERREDIPALVEHFIAMHNRELKKAFKSTDSATLKLLMSLPWKGNVRELDNIVEHAMILGEGEWITLKDLPRALQQDAGVPAAPASDNLRDALRAYEKAHVQAVLARVDQDKKAAAKRLGVSLSSLYRKLEEFEIGPSHNALPA